MKAQSADFVNRHFAFAALLLAGPLSCLLLAGFYPVRFQGTVSLQTFFLFVILYPVLEEIVFRAGLMDLLARTTAFRSNRILINCMTSLMFAFAHAAVHQSLAYLLVFFPSLAFGSVFQKYNSLIPPIALHSVYNTSFVIFVS